MSRPDAILIALALTVGGCGGEERDPPEPAAEVTRRAAEPSEPSEPAPAAEPARPAPEAVAIAVDRETPDSGCALGDPVALGIAGAEWVDVAVHGGAFVVVAQRRRPRGGPPGGDVEELLVWRAGHPTRVRHLLEHGLPDGHRRAGPTLAIGAGGLVLAFTDGQRRLLLLDVEGDGPPALVAANASERFRLAVAPDGLGWMVAWTDAHETPMRVFGMRVAMDRTAVGEPVDRTPLAGGAAAPSFVSGEPETLIFLDPRAATSVALRASVIDGALGPASVARPVGLVAEPPETAAVRLGDQAYLAFTGVGALARSAVGIVALSGSAPPRALVPGVGYGALHVDAEALAEAGAVVVADAPQGPAPDAPREVRVLLIDDDGEMSEPAVLRGPEGGARRARVAAAARTIAVAFVDEGEAYLAVGRCAAP